MNETIEDRSRAQIAQFLPDAIARALTSYRLFMERDFSGEQAKAFSEHHSACKVAVAHIELLLKLARWADLPDAAGAVDANSNAMLAAMMAEAEKELHHIREIESD